MAATAEFFAMERFDWEGDEELRIPGFAVPALGRLPDEFQSYPRVRLLPERIQKIIFDAQNPNNDVTDPGDPIVTMTAWDCIQVGEQKRLKRPSGGAGATITADPEPFHADPVDVPPAASDGDPFTNDLPVQAVMALKEAGIHTLEEAQALTDDDLLRLKGFGPGSLARIRG